MRLVFTDRAQADLLEAWLYIAEDNLAAADRVLDPRHSAHKKQNFQSQQPVK